MHCWWEGVCGAEDGTQGLVHARRAAVPGSYTLTQQCRVVQPLGNSVAVPRKVERVPVGSSNSASWYVPQRIRAGARAGIGTPCSQPHSHRRGK